MEVLGKIIEVLDYSIETPKPYGAFHLTFLILTVLLSVYLSVKYKDASEKTYKKIVFIAWVIMVVLELYKQFNYTFSYDGKAITSDYQWYAFPYQFCSTPLYVFPFIVFCKNKNVYQAVVSFTMTFVFFAGVAVMLYPNDIYISTLGIDIQTSIHHGLQAVIGSLTICRFRKHLKDIKFYLKGMIAFVVLLAIALVLNLLAPLFTDETFNMFYISPYFNCHIPILSIINEKAPYIIFLISYVLGFMLVALIIYQASNLIYKLIVKNSHEK